MNDTNTEHEGMTMTDTMDKIRPGVIFKVNGGLKYMAVGKEENGIGQMMVRCRVVKKDGSTGTTIKFFLAQAIKEIY